MFKVAEHGLEYYLYLIHISFTFGRSHIFAISFWIFDNLLVLFKFAIALLAAIGGPTGDLLEQNAHALNQISANLAAFQVNWHYFNWFYQLWMKKIPLKQKPWIRPVIYVFLLVVWVQAESKMWLPNFRRMRITFLYSYVRTVFYFFPVVAIFPFIYLILCILSKFFPLYAFDV